jgi:hypothetical protein
MNCDGVRGLLSAYVDGQLSPGELLRAEQHLRRCSDCADEVDSLRQTIALVASLDEVEVPSAFRASLHQQLVAVGAPVAVRRIPAAPVWQHHVRRWAMPAAAAAAALAIGLSGMKAAELPGLQGESQMVADLPSAGRSGATAPVITQAPPAGTDSQSPSKRNETAITTPPTTTVENAHQESTTPSRPTTVVTDGQGAHVATNTTPTPEPVKLASRWGYSASLSVADDASQGVRTALVDRYPTGTAMAGQVTLTLAQAEFEADQTFLQLLLGSSLTLEKTDLAQAIHQAELRLQDRQTALANFDRRLASYTDPVEKANAAKDRNVYLEQIEQANDGLKRLLDREGKVVLTIQFSIPTR